ncbi:MAG: hypothetical protein COA57_13100 [Flavobacteriales bacterium]|nr:MAG: hypothetical protein COA57_13100 [Flavobacteriales bacterium]
MACIKEMTDIDTHKVALKFFDFDCSPDELTKEFGLEPTETALKGQEYHVGPEHRRLKKTWPWNFWMHQVIIVKNRHWIGDQIDDFLDNIIKPRQGKIKKIISTCESEFSIVQYIYEGCNPGLHFDNDRLKIITDIGAEIDVDIYVFGNGQEDEKENK